MAGLKKVFKRIDGYREEIINLQRDLTARVALGPENNGSGEREKAIFIKGLLEAMSPDILNEIKAPDDRVDCGYRPNLLARWEGTRKGQDVWVLSHSDVVPPGELSLWDGNPYEIRVDGDRIIGRGVEDNQHGFVSSYLALKAILDSGEELKKSVGLVVVADEETGSLYGLSHLLDYHGDLFGREDLIVVPDFGNREGTMIEVAEKSMLWLKFVVTGRQCHASTPSKGKNSLLGAAKLILELERLKKRFDFSNPLFRPPESTFEPTKMEANVPNVNTIPGRDVFYLDCRILPEYGLNEVISASKLIVASISDETGLSIDVEPVYRQDASSPTSPEASVVKALTGAIRKVTGRQAEATGIGGGTVAAFFRKRGLPVAVWSTFQDSAHQPNEYCLISDIITDAKVFACLYQGEYEY